MEDRASRMLVIGAGPVGLGMAKSLKQHGIDFDVLEADADLGGNWYHGVYPTAHTITSRKATEYTDYPIPAEFPEFLNVAQMLAYLRGYADHFELRPHIEFKKKVVMVRPRVDKGWQVALASGEERVYKGVLVCTGHHWSRRFPNYPGRFSGALLHAKDYSSPEAFSGKRVLVIGGGNSGCDIAKDAARVAYSSDLSLRRGYWFMPKKICGIPFHNVVPLGSPLWLKRFLLELASRIIVGDYRRYGLQKPNHRLFDHPPTLDSELLEHLKYGRIRPRPDVKHLDGQRVEFVDGSAAEYDIVVFATGYELDFHFFPKDFVPIVGGVAQLYGPGVLPGFKHLYIVGTTNVRYGFGPLVTMGGDLMARLVKMQDTMTLPVGSVLKAMGIRPPSSASADAGDVLRQVRRGRWLLRWLVPRAERRLLRAGAYSPPPPPSEVSAARASADMQVY